MIEKIHFSKLAQGTSTQTKSSAPMRVLMASVDNNVITWKRVNIKTFGLQSPE